MIYQVDQQQLVLTTAIELKNHIEMPQWAKFAKTGAHRETLPRNPDWWYIRAASILRMCYKEGPVGVSKLRTRYGGRKNRGMRPDKFALAGGKVIRTILQQLEEAKLVKQHKVGNHKGRIASPAGKAILAKAAKTVGKTKPVEKPKNMPVQQKTETTTNTQKESKTETPKTEEKAKKQEQIKQKTETKNKTAEHEDTSTKEKQQAIKQEDKKSEIETKPETKETEKKAESVTATATEKSTSLEEK